MLADHADHIIGVDTHTDTNTAVALRIRTGEVAEALTETTSKDGYAALYAYAQEHCPTRRVWAIESTAFYGSGLTAYLKERGERVLEVDRPKRPRAKGGAKSDEIDACEQRRRSSIGPTRPSPEAAASARRCGSCCAPASSPPSPGPMRCGRCDRSSLPLLMSCARSCAGLARGG